MHSHAHSNRFNKTSQHVNMATQLFNDKTDCASDLEFTTHLQATNEVWAPWKIRKQVCKREKHVSVHRRPSLLWKAAVAQRVLLEVKGKKGNISIKCHPSADKKQSAVYPAPWRFAQHNKPHACLSWGHMNAARASECLHRLECTQVLEKFRLQRPRLCFGFYINKWCQNGCKHRSVCVEYAWFRRRKCSLRKISPIQYVCLKLG